MKYHIQQNNILGTALSSNEKHTIVGAGMSGLLLGYFLKQKGIPFQIIEKSNRAGGLVHSHKIPNLGLAEEAANGFIWCQEIEDICKEISLDIQYPSPLSKARYLVRNNKLKKFPLGILESVNMVSKAIMPHSQKLSTVEDFGKVFFGEKFNRQILEPAMAGIYGTAIENLSFEGVLKILAEEFNHTNSLIGVIRRIRKNSKKKGKKLSGTHSFKGGFSQFPLHLAEYLKEHIIYNQEVREISGSTVLTCPAYIAKTFFEDEIHKILSNIQYTPFVTTTLVIPRKDLHRFKDGFGCLIPRNEGLTILGVLFNSCIFPDRVENKEHISLTCMIRDEGDGSIINLEKEEILSSIIVPDIKKLLGFDGKILDYHCRKWQKGIPVYNPELVGYWSKLDSLLKSKHPNIRLLGNYTGQISIRGMAQQINKCLNDC